jgi:hypothetical protein
MGAMRVLTAAAVVVAVGTTHCVGQVATFVVLPPGPGDTYVKPRGISGDGTTVFGDTGVLFSGNVEAYRWTAAAGGERIGALVSGPFSQGLASNTSGSAVFGRDNGSGGFVWNGPSPGTAAVLPGGMVLDVSGDGAVRLTSSHVIGASDVALPVLPGDQSVAAVSISAAGTGAALTSHFFQSGGSGYGYGGGGPDIVRDQACRWTGAGGTVGCGFLPGTDRSFATCISEDGAVVLGFSRSGNSGVKRGFRWTSGGGMSEMLPIAGQATPLNVEPVDSSGDGAVVACLVDGEACVWTQAGGFATIKQVLLGNGWDVGAWTFYDVAGISDDGSVVTGQALDGSGQINGWVTPLGGSCTGPASPWIASRRVIVADGDALPGGGFASSVSEVTINDGGAALVRVGADVWLAPGGGGSLSLVIQGASDGFSGVGTATMNDAGVVALTRLRSQLVGGSPPVSETTNTVAVGLPGSIVTVAQHGDAAPADSGGGTLRTYGDFYGPLMSNGGRAVFQCGIDGGTQGAVRAFAYNALTGGGLVRSAPAVSINNPVLRAVSDGGIVVRTAAEGVLAGGPPPAVQDLIAPVGAAAPGIAGGTFSSFADVGVNGTGTVVFVATVSTPGGVRDAVYLRPASGTLQLVARQGMQVGADAVLSGVSRAMIASTGSVYFVGTLSGGETVVVKVKGDGTTVIAARDGELAPGAGPCRSLSGWQMLGLDGRRLLLAANASGPSGSSQMLATWGEEEGLSVLARTGEVMTVRPGVSGPVASVGLSVLGGNGEDGRAHAMRGNHVVYSVQLTTGAGPVRVVLADDLPVLACGAADLGAQGGVPGADGRLDNNDFIAFIDLFFGHDAAADFGGQGGVAAPDGHLDNNDFIVFIDRFFGGCD